MKKRICLVGFEDGNPTALDALKQAVSGISGTWETTFVQDANEALAALAAEPFDAVVTRMRLRGVNGAELLQQTGKLHPKTLRFVTGDVADQELVINCIGGTHQFIAEPCDPKTLIATVQRGLALDAWLSTEALQQLVPRLQRLPSLPSTYFEVLKQVESPNASVQNIGEVVSRDPAVTARLLQMVNSAAFALDQKVTDPVHAVSLLGMETVKSLVLCLQVFSQNEQAKQAGLSFDQLWRHSSAVAETARQITRAETRSARQANDAFTAGLLHDVGRILLATNLPKEYAAVIAAAREHGRALEAEESAQLGVTHAQVGAYLLALWGMPASLVEAAALHHVPSQTASREFSLLTAVHVANVFAHEQDQHAAGPSLPKLDAAYLSALGLATRPDAWRRALAGEAGPEVPAETAKPEAQAAIIRPQPQAATGGGNWLLKLLIPATAVLVGVVGLIWWFGNSSALQPLEVLARTPAAPAPANPPPAPETAPAPAAPIESAPPQPEAMPAVEVAPALAADAPAPIAATPEIPAEATPPPTPTRGFDSVKVQGIFYSSTPTVVINGKTLSVGGKINDVEVVAIGPSSVTLRSVGQEKTLRFK
jgi:HD-like signal output (HDOD) protein